MLGISPDAPAKLGKFRARDHLTITLLSDPDKDVLTERGVYRQEDALRQDEHWCDPLTFIMTRRAGSPTRRPRHQGDSATSPSSARIFGIHTVAGHQGGEMRRALQVAVWVVAMTALRAQAAEAQVIRNVSVATAAVLQRRHAHRHSDRLDLRAAGHRQSMRRPGRRGHRRGVRGAAALSNYRRVRHRPQPGPQPGLPHPYDRVDQHVEPRGIVATAPA